MINRRFPCPLALLASILAVHSTRGDVRRIGLNGRHQLRGDILGRRNQHRLGLLFRSDETRYEFPHRRGFGTDGCTR